MQKVKFYRIFSFLFAPLLFLCSCGNNDEPYVNSSISIDRSIETMANGGGDFTVQLQASHSWSSKIQYSDNTEWLRLSCYAGGYEDEYDITVNVSPNYGEQRSATIVFYLKEYDKECKLDIVQYGNNSGGTAQLSAPTGLRASVSGTDIYLSWNPVNGAAHYNIYYSPIANGSWTDLGYTDQTSVTLQAESSGTYYFAVTAFDSNWQESNYSATVSCTVQNTGGGSGGTTKPDAPSGLTATFTGNAYIPEVTLRWNAVSGATSYNVYRSTSASGSYTKIGSSTWEVYLDASPKNGTNYYKVTAVNGAGESSLSSYASASYDSNAAKPGMVTYGSCTVSGTSMTLRWTIPSGAGIGKPDRILLRVLDDSTGEYITIQTLSGTATSVTFTYTPYVCKSQYREGYVYVGVILENSYGTGGGVPKVYDTNTKQWIN